MCGIAGSFSAGLTDEMMLVVNSCVQTQFARGPDHSAVEKISTGKSSLILGHNRLSIIDLTAAANQPLWDSFHEYCIAYNGEIYNYLELRSELLGLGYQFNSVSDTEVILNAFKCWGIEAVNKFNGAFAFAIFEKNKNRLWLVRDRFGVKPLYFYIKDNILYFASTSNAIAAHFKLKPNLEFLSRGLHYYVYEDGSEATQYQYLYALLPGHYFYSEIKENNNFSYQIKKYYDLQANVDKLKESFAKQSMKESLDCLSHHLMRAVTIRLRSDVPVGVSLSGGLDSSTIAALIAEKHSDIVGFTFGYPTATKSEGPLVYKLANKLGLNVEYIWPTAEEMVQAFPKVLRAQDSPFAGMSIVAQYLVFQKVHEKGIKVLLGGQGGDEAFMGYRKYHIFWLQQLLNKKQYSKALLFSLQLLSMCCSEIRRTKFYWQQRFRYINQKKSNSNLALNPQSVFLGLKKSQDIQYRQFEDITKYSLPTLLRYEDRNSMAHSVESRLPFMDYHIIELGLAFPESLKLRNGYGKWAIREVMRHKIPEEIRAARYKRGFDVPFSKLISAGLGQAIRNQLEDNYEIIEEFIRSSAKINIIFSDQQFLQKPNKVAEAITLLWLGRCYS